MAVEGGYGSRSLFTGEAENRPWYLSELVRALPFPAEVPVTRFGPVVAVQGFCPFSGTLHVLLSPYKRGDLSLESLCEAGWS